MKRFIGAAILVGALVALVGGTALAAEPVERSRRWQYFDHWVSLLSREV